MLLKKIAHISLALILMVSSVGLVVSVHYCRGDLASISVFKESKACCTNPNCCQNKTVSIQFDEDYVVQDVQQSEKAITFSSIINFVQIEQNQFSNNKNITSYYFVSESPPLEMNIVIQTHCLLI